MKTIIEQNGTKGKFYEVYINDKPLNTIKVFRENCIMENYHYVFLIQKGQIIPDVFRYINVINYEHNFNVRNQIASALKLLYSFQEIVGLQFEKFEQREIVALSHFLSGHNVKGNSIEFKLLEQRGNNTHNIYLGHIRAYFNYLGINSPYLSETSVAYIQKSNIGFMGFSKKIETQKYNSNKTKYTSPFAPMSISVEQYKQIKERNKQLYPSFWLRNDIILTLMFEYGCRIGEILGTTLEDVKKNNQFDSGIIILRNRNSDKHYQSAKGATSYQSEITLPYELRNLQSGKYQQTLDIDISLYWRIIDYINESRNILDLSEKCLANLEQTTADSLEGNDRNYYIFLNKNCTPLSSSGWNKIVKTLFIDCGIPIDTQKKSTNLNHRLRHGTANFLKDELKMSEAQIKDYMRHRSIESTNIYFNPTEESVAQIRKSITDSIHTKLEDNNE